MMKSRLFLLLWMCCSVLLTACENDEPTPQPPVEGSRTVLAYLASDNSLSSFALADLEEMRLGMEKVSANNVHLLVYIDSNSSPRLIELKNEGGELVENTVKTYENRNWVGQDGNRYMNISDLVTILSADAVPHFDFVLFDACFMQSIEVAYALRSFTDYYIGSPTEIPGPGARYDVLVPALFSDGEVALKVAAAYYTPYKEIYLGQWIQNDPWNAGVSVCVLKSSELEPLASITKQVLSDNTDSDELRSIVFDYDQRSKMHVGYYDFVELMQQLTDASGFAAWKQAYDLAVSYWQTTPKNCSGSTGMFSMEGSSGVSHYIPSSSHQSAAVAYRSTEWYKSAGFSKLGW